MLCCGGKLLWREPEPRTMLDQIRGRARTRRQELLPRLGFKGVTSAFGCGTSAVSRKRWRPMRLVALLVVLVAAVPAAGKVDGEPPRRGRFRPFKGDGTIHHESCEIKAAAKPSHVPNPLPPTQLALPATQSDAFRERERELESGFKGPACSTPT